MKRIIVIFILCYLWLPSLSQLPSEVRRNKLIFLINITTHSGVDKGYLWKLTDSTIVLSPGKQLNGARQPFQVNVFPEQMIQDYGILHIEGRTGQPGTSRQ